jgi:hypothetical protein
VVAAVGVLVAVGAVLFVLIKDATSVAQPPSAPTGDDATTITPASDTEPIPTSTNTAEDTVEVLLHAKPEGAVALVRGVELSLPTLVPIKGGQPVTAEVKAEGYESLTVEIDGSTKKVAVELEPKAGAVPHVRPRPYPKRKKKSQPPSEVVDPWEK